MSGHVESIEGHTPHIPASAWVHGTAAVIGQVRLGERVSVWPQATLRGDEGVIEVGDDTNIQDGTTVHMTGGLSHTRIGARVTVGHNCIIHGCTIEDDCLIGMGSIIIDNAVIGAGSVIGAGTLVTAGKIIPPGSLVFGRPMQIVRPVNDKERAQIHHGWTHYVERSRVYQAAARGT